MNASGPSARTGSGSGAGYESLTHGEGAARPLLWFSGPATCKWLRLYETPMTRASPAPLIGVTSCLKPRDEVRLPSVGDKYVDAVVTGATGMPVLIPALGERLDPGAPARSTRRAAGHRQPAPTSSPPTMRTHRRAEGNLADPARDATTSAADPRGDRRRACRCWHLPRLQELNVALGGTLHQQVHELPGRPRPPRGQERAARRALRRGAPGHARRRAACSQALLGGDVGIEVNSLHGQGIDRLAPGLVVEAHGDGRHDRGGQRVETPPAFALAVQWHPEWRVPDNPFSSRCSPPSARCRARRAAGAGNGPPGEAARSR